MTQRTISFHRLFVIVSVVIAIPCIIFVIHHQQTVGSVYHGWECAPMIYGIIAMYLIPTSLFLWALGKGIFEKMWAWNPPITFGKKTKIPRAYTKKDGS